MDGNIPAQSMKYLCHIAQAHGVPGSHSDYSLCGYLKM